LSIWTGTWVVAADIWVGEDREAEGREAEDKVEGREAAGIWVAVEDKVEEDTGEGDMVVGMVEDISEAVGDTVEAGTAEAGTAEADMAEGT